MPKEQSSPAREPLAGKDGSGKADLSDVEKGATGPISAQARAGGPGQDPGGEPELYEPGAAKFWLIIVCNFLAMTLVALDRTIVATAIPRITDDFHSLGDIGWYGSAYMLGVSTFLLIFGRIYRLYDTKWTFLSSIVVFEAGSTICAAAPNSTVFIIGRAVAGAASAGIFTGAIVAIIPMVPLHKRPMFQGLFGMVFGITAVAGPLLGGAFTSSSLTWRWCFWINLPVGAFSWVLMVFVWNPPRQHRQDDDNNSNDNNTTNKNKKLPSLGRQIKNLDPLGVACLVPSVVCLLLALQWGGATYAWSDGRVVVLVVLFVAFGAAFALVQVLLPDTATVPPRVVRQRSVCLAATFTFFLAGSMLMMVFFLPVWFQTVKAADPVQSGIDTLPVMLSLVAAAFVSGAFTQKLGYYVPAMLASPAIMAVGEGLLATLRPDTGSPRWIAYQFLAGFGLGLGMQTGGLAVQTVLPAADVAQGVAVNMFAQQLGGAVFVSVGDAVLSNLLVSGLAGIPGISGSSSSVVDQGTTALLQALPPQYLPQALEAYNHACTRVFLASMGLALAALLAATGMEWKSIKKGRGRGGGKGKEGGQGAPEARTPATAAAAATDAAATAEKKQSAADESGQDKAASPAQEKKPSPAK